MAEKVDDEGAAQRVIDALGGHGIGDSYYPLPRKCLKYDTDQLGCVVDVDKDRLEGAPRYRESESPDWAEPN